MPEKTKRTLVLTGLFASFMLLQLTILWMGNHAGEGYLPVEQRERVYYVIQVFVILGFFVHAGVQELLGGRRAAKGLLAGVLAVFFAGSGAMLALEASFLYLAVTFATVFCLGYLGGAVYLRMSLATAAGAATARSMGLGCSAAIALQYLLQLWRGPAPLLPPVMLAAFVFLGAVLFRQPETEPAPRQEPVPARRLAIVCLIAATLLLFTNFYNSYIHHLQVQSGYTDFNVYAWPRLMWIPCYLLFAAIGDRRQGKLVPVTALCVGLAGLLNSVLTGSTGAYWLNMCLFYCAIAASVSYYNLTFWRLAPRTRHPALWAPMGRILDSGSVLLSYWLHYSALAAPAVLAMDVAGLAVVILLMAVNGDFNFAASAPEPARPEPPDEAERLASLAARCGLSPAETKVLRELVLTEDKQTAIAETLSIRVSTVQHHTTAIYRKTGVSSRAGLCLLYNEEAEGSRKGEPACAP